MFLTLKRYWIPFQVEWSKIRRMMGKPRRCSAAFFAEERAELMRKRQKIRLLQQRKQVKLSESSGNNLSNAKMTSTKSVSTITSSFDRPMLPALRICQMIYLSKSQLVPA